MLKEGMAVAKNCGKYDRTIYRIGDRIKIGCQSYTTTEDVINAIKLEYVIDNSARKHYISAVNYISRNNDEEILKNDENEDVRLEVAKFNDKYHEHFKDDGSWEVRLEVAKFSDKYHEQFKNDEDEDVRLEVAKFSDKYHEHFKDDGSWKVRLEVAKFSDKYHEHFKDDEDEDVRLGAASVKDCNINQKSD